MVHSYNSFSINSESSEDGYISSVMSWSGDDIFQTFLGANLATSVDKCIAVRREKTSKPKGNGLHFKGMASPCLMEFSSVKVTVSGLGRFDTRRNVSGASGVLMDPSTAGTTHRALGFVGD